eukprot:2743748-Prymnesium_polylepis.2
MTAITIAPLAAAPCRFTNLGVLRKQECERVAALRDELGKCKASVVEVSGVWHTRTARRAARFGRCRSSTTLCRSATRCRSITRCHTLPQRHTLRRSDPGVLASFHIRPVTRSTLPPPTPTLSVTPLWPRTTTIEWPCALRRSGCAWVGSSSRTRAACARRCLRSFRSSPRRRLPGWVRRSGSATPLRARACGASRTRRTCLRWRRPSKPGRRRTPHTAREREGGTGVGREREMGSEAGRGTRGGVRGSSCGPQAVRRLC